MAGWYKIDETDALNLAEIQNSFNDRRSRYKRLRMLNFIWSKINSKGYPCPYFRVGRKTIAEKCGVSEDTARDFIEYLEREGWVVRVGDDKHGRTPRRTFWWLADAAEFSTSGGKLPPTTRGKLPPCQERVTPKGGEKHPPVTPNNMGETGTSYPHIQSTEYSQRAVDPVHSALAEDGPLYSGATHDDAEEPKPKRSHREEALAWYRERGLPDPPVVSPPPGGDY